MRCEKDCGREAEHSDRCCIFHTREGKVRIVEVDDPSARGRKKPEVQGADRQEIKEKFISEFDNLLAEVKSQPAPKDGQRRLDIRKFIFPAFDDREWQQLWRQLRTGASYHIDFSAHRIEIDASQAEFGGNVDFVGAQLGEATDFSGAKFGEATDFSWAKFDAATNFSGAIFGAETVFRQAIFDAGILFIDAKFGAAAYFRSAIFAAEAYFISAEFGAKVSFYLTKLGDRTFFAGSRFDDKAIFRETSFGEVTSFEKSKIGDEFIIQDCYFPASAKIDFTKSEVRHILRFIKSLRPKENSADDDDTPDQPAENLTLLFRDLRFYDDGYLLLEDISLERASFWRTNFSDIRQRIDFIRCSWGRKRDGCKGVVDDDKFGDECLAPEENHAELEREYRQIRIAYEARGGFSEAGDFFIGEMAARGRRLRQEKNYFLILLHRFYDVIGRWGESPARTAKVLFLIWFLGGALVLLGGFYASDLSGGKTPISINYDLCFRNCSPIDIGDLAGDYSRALIYTLQAMTIFRAGEYAPGSSATSAIIVLAHILGPLLIAVFGVALRRRFRRISGE